MLSNYETLLDYAMKKNYDLDSFNKYYSYQLIHKPNTVISVEEYSILYPEFNADSEEELRFFCLLHGYPSIDDLPDYCSFVKYCRSNNINPISFGSYTNK